jgi:hypothetical protein
MFSVSLCAAVFDPDGDVLIPATADSELSAAQRRVSRTATLDGAATLEDLGHTASDSTIKVVFKLADADFEARILRLIQIYPLLTLSTRYGCFLGVADKYTPTAQGATLQFLVQQQIS